MLLRELHAAGEHVSKHPRHGESHPKCRPEKCLSGQWHQRELKRHVHRRDDRPSGNGCKYQSPQNHSKTNLQLALTPFSSAFIYSRHTLAQYGPRYNWSSHDQSLILGAYFYGYLVTSLPAGVLAERFGGRNLVGSMLAISALLTAFTPLAATYGLWVIVANRALLGVCGVSLAFLFVLFAKLTRCC